MKADTISARLDPETAKKLELLVKATARSKSYLVAEAIEAYVEEQAWQIGAIREGIKEADKGKFAHFALQGGNNFLSGSATDSF